MTLADQFNQSSIRYYHINSEVELNPHRCKYRRNDQMQLANFKNLVHLLIKYNKGI